MEHTQEYALTKTTWTNEEDVAWLVFQQRQIHRLIHIILILFYNGLKVIDAVRQTFHILIHDCSFYNLHLQK